VFLAATGKTLGFSLEAQAGERGKGEPAGCSKVPGVNVSPGGVESSQWKTEMQERDGNRPHQTDSQVETTPSKRILGLTVRAK
jgi:hypothetical protein